MTAAPRSWPNGPVLLVASGVAPLGAGAAGGVSHVVRMTARLLRERDVETAVLAPKGSDYTEGPLIEIAGTLQPTLAGSDTSRAWPVPEGGVIAQMWRPILDAPEHWGLILNFQHDWLPYFLSHTLGPRLAHLPNMGRVNGATDREIARLARAHPERVAFVSPSQAAEFGAAANAPFYRPGIDLARYPFQAAPRPGTLAWAGRIAPEKGLKDAARAAALAGKRLLVAGAVTDPRYFETVVQAFPETVEHRGFLDQPALAAMFGEAEALLLTQSWAEAFGILSAEALAVGTPLIAYDRGANRQFVREGQTGTCVPPGDVAAIVEAIARAPSFNRRAARALAEERFSLAAMGADLDAWLARLERGF